MTEAANIGSTLLTPPPTSSPGDVASITPVPFASAPESTWVVVTVSGELGLELNPECNLQPPNWPCQLGSPTMAFESDPGTYGPVAVYAQQGASNGRVSLRGIGSATATSAIGLHFQAAAGTISGALQMIPVWAWDPNHGDGPASYKLSGGYTVSAMAVPNPLRLTDGAPDSSGTRTYSVEPLYGLELRNPLGLGFNMPAGGVFWYFFPGDSVSDQPGFSGAYRGIPECQFQTTCQYRPPRSGRVQATAYVEGKYVAVRSMSPPPQQCSPSPLPLASRSARYSVSGTAACGDGNPNVRVICSGATGGDPVRGTQVSCKTTVSPAIPFVVTSRTAQARHLVVSDTVRHEHAAGETDEWTGTAVAETRVTVKVEVAMGGQERTLQGTGRFGILRRPWSVYRVTAPTVVHAVHPTQMGLIPGQPNYGVFNLDSLQIGAAGVATVNEGPNAGAVLFTTQPQFSGQVAIIHLHPALYPPFPAAFPPFQAGVVGTLWEVWYADQNGNAGPGWHQPYRSCSQADLPTLRRELERHEGVTLASNSHAGLANRIFQSSKLQERFEEFYQQSVTDSAFRLAALGVYSLWWANEFWPSQHNFDVGPSSDTNQTWAAVGCSTDNDLKAP